MILKFVYLVLNWPNVISPTKLVKAERLKIGFKSMMPSAPSMHDLLNNKLVKENVHMSGNCSRTDNAVFCLGGCFQCKIGMMNTFQVSNSPGSSQPCLLTIPASKTIL